MIKLTALFILLAVALPLCAQDKKDDEIHLKSGDVIVGKVNKVEEAGISLKTANGYPLFIKWALIRGDKHLDLRQKAVDWIKVESVVRYADFCRDLALDKEEAEALTKALVLDPKNTTLRERAKRTPGVVLPDEPQPRQPDPEVKKPDDPPPPTPGRKLRIKFDTVETAAAKWLATELEAKGYTTVSDDNYDFLIKLELELVVTKNPTYYGKEVSATVDGTLKFKITERATKEAITDDSLSVKDIYSKKGREDAKKQATDSLLEQARDKFDRVLTKRK